MLTLSRGAMSVAVAGVLLMGAVFAACGLDENGIVGSDASVTPDVSTDTLILPDIQVDNYVAPPCSDSDASLDASCLPAAVPAGWIPIAIKVGDSNVTCPGAQGDFVARQYVKDPTLDTDSCQCSGTCTASGNWTCSGSVRAGYTNCYPVDASAGTCFQDNGRNWFSGTVVTSGAPACSGAQQTGTLDASATPIGACVPQKCQSDFCSLATQQFSLCIFNTTVTDGGCPSTFPNSTVAGVQAYAACTACSCNLTNANAGCTGTVSVYSTNDCTTDGGTPLATAAADGGCNNAQGFNSVILDVDAATPDCQLSAAGGEPMLAGPLTICCP